MTVRRDDAEIAAQARADMTDGVPDWVFHLPNEQLAIFMDAVGLGSDAPFACTSRRLADDALRLLARFGVAGSVEPVGELGFRVTAGARVLQAAGRRGSLAASGDGDDCWDTIADIEYLREEEVFDATVLDTHNFVADGITVHNSLEQDADMVILLHREDAYDKQSPRQGEADFIVAKHRNGATDTLPVAFQGALSRFVDMQR